MLTKLHIENFRYFERFTIPLSPGPSILVGDNDAGKSTLLEAIALECRKVLLPPASPRCELADLLEEGHNGSYSQ